MIRIPAQFHNAGLKDLKIPNKPVAEFPCYFTFTK